MPMVEEALLGLPLLQAEPGRIRALAVEEATRVLAAGQGERVQCFGEQLLEPLKTGIMAVLDPALLRPLPLAEFFQWWAALCVAVEAACKAAAASWPTLIAEAA